MTFILIGVFGFFVLFLNDVVAMQRRFILARISFFTGGTMIIISVLGVIISAERISFPVAVKAAGAIVAIIFIVIGTYSVLIEIPLKQRMSGTGNKSGLVSTGTYALVRHPGVLWFVIVLPGLFCVFPSVLLGFTIPVWIVMDFLLVYAQEKIILEKQFGIEYAEYKRHVPFIVPNPNSVRNCFRTLFLIVR